MLQCRNEGLYPLWRFDNWAHCNDNGLFLFFHPQKLSSLHLCHGELQHLKPITYTFFLTQGQKGDRGRFGDDGFPGEDVRIISLNFFAFKTCGNIDVRSIKIDSLSHVVQSKN